MAIGPRDTPDGWRRATADLAASAAVCFGPPARAGFAHGQRRTADSLVATLATKAGMIRLPGPQREDLLERVRRFLVNRPETASRTFTLRMRTCVLRFVRG